MFFCRRVSGPRRAFARRSVPDQNGSLRMDRDANHYRPGHGEPVGRPLARSSRGDASRFGQSSFSCSRHFVMLPLRPYFLDEFADVVAALAGALGAFDAQYVELTRDVAADEISPLRHDVDIITRPVTVRPLFQWSFLSWPSRQQILGASLWSSMRRRGTRSIYSHASL